MQRKPTAGLIHLAGLPVRRVPAVQHELVAVGIGEDRHVADAGVEGVAEELDSLGLEHGAHLSDVVAAQRPRVALLGDERHALLLGLPDPEARVAGPLLPLSVLVGAQPQDAAVEGAGALGVLGGDTEEVESFDDSHETSLHGSRSRCDLIQLALRAKSGALCRALGTSGPLESV